MHRLYTQFHEATQRKVCLAVEQASVDGSHVSSLRTFQFVNSESCICHLLDTPDLSAPNVEFLDDQSIQYPVKESGVRTVSSFEKARQMIAKCLCPVWPIEREEPECSRARTTVGSPQSALKANSCMLDGSDFSSFIS